MQIIILKQLNKSPGNSARPMPVSVFCKGTDQGTTETKGNVSLWGEILLKPFWPGG